MIDGSDDVWRMRRTMTQYVLVFIAAATAGSAWNSTVFAQEAHFVLTGYGTTGYEARITDSLRHNFSASFSPVTLFQMGEDMLFEGELDFEFDGTSTTTNLEHAQVHYLGFERVQMTAGKFHLPFGIWMHPNWINKMPDPPLLYGHAHGGVAEEALLPILFDVGVMAKGKQRISETWVVGGALWVSQGPALVSEEHDDHAHEEHDGGHAASVEVPEVGYGVNYVDNNANKMVGARLRFMNRWNFMVDLAGFHAKYDAENRLGINGANLSVKWQRGRLDVRGEGILLRQEFWHGQSVEGVNRGGYYLQVTRRMGAYEPVIRWSHLPTSRVEGEHVQAARRQLAVGLNYWITPSIPLKVAYQRAWDGPDGVLVQWAFGF